MARKARSAGIEPCLGLVDLIRAQERLQRLLIVADAVVGHAQRIQQIAILGFKLTGFLAVAQGLAIARHLAARQLHQFPGEIVECRRIFGIRLGDSDGFLPAGRTHAGQCSQPFQDVGTQEHLSEEIGHHLIGCPTVLYFGRDARRLP